eukprot:TRINITY_DN8665_c0_g2_i1.p1 TRINITY_DN8665_c0_g2~~TRINITY_DN8665_c0_g2_i1.p1  ORF type:complete len:381 (-),score=23.18 TRINITY_DN8665_c0_g2_i1:324-1409(-)
MIGDIEWKVSRTFIEAYEISKVGRSCVRRRHSEPAVRNTAVDSDMLAHKNDTVAEHRIIECANTSSDVSREEGSSDAKAYSTVVCLSDSGCSSCTEGTLDPSSVHSTEDCYTGSRVACPSEDNASKHASLHEDYDVHGKARSDGLDALDGGSSVIVHNLPYKITPFMFGRFLHAAGFQNLIDSVEVSCTGSQRTKYAVIRFRDVSAVSRFQSMFGTTMQIVPCSQKRIRLNLADHLDCEQRFLHRNTKESEKLKAMSGVPVSRTSHMWDRPSGVELHARTQGITSMRPRHYQSSSIAPSVRPTMQQQSIQHYTHEGPERGSHAERLQLPRFCHHCGNPRVPFANFCEWCGCRFSKHEGTGA